MHVASHVASATRRAARCTSFASSSSSAPLAASPALAASSSSIFGARLRAPWAAWRRPYATPAAPQFLPVDVTREWTPQSRRVGALGMKCGMTMEWTPWGERLPLTVIELQDVQVVQVKLEETDGFNALQLGAGWQKRKRINESMARHYESRMLPLKRRLREFRVTPDALLPVGTSITARHFVPGQHVDVQGVTRGKGFQGVMKRWGFSGQPASHGHSLSHRSGGSSGGAAGGMYATRVRKGMKMPGNMGNKRRTVQSLLVYKINVAHNLVFLKGTIPGSKGSFVRVTDAKLKPFLSKKGCRTPPPFPTFLPGDPIDDADAEELVVPKRDDDPLVM